MSTFVYPTSAELQAIAQKKMPRLTADRPIFDFFPIRTQDAAALLWEQLDSFAGLQQLRGINGAPHKVNPVGLKRFRYDPGVYGEFIPINEQELTERRQQGSFGTPINIEDLILERQDQLLLRRLDRIEQICWLLLTTGTFSVSLPYGGVAHSDTFTLQTFDSTVGWGTAATSTPLADFRAVQLKRRGYSVSFGADARAYMNQVTYNKLAVNTNAADLYGRRTAGLGTFNNLPGINSLLLGDNLPSIVIYDEGYLTTPGDETSFVPFIPDDKVVVIGRRPAGQVVGEYRMVRNANNPDLAPGPYMKIIDRGETHVPREIEVHDGHNGGPVLFFGSAIVLMDVSV